MGTPGNKWHGRRTRSDESLKPPCECIAGDLVERRAAAGTVVLCIPAVTFDLSHT